MIRIGLDGIGLAIVCANVPTNERIISFHRVTPDIPLYSLIHSIYKKQQLFLFFSLSILLFLNLSVSLPINRIYLSLFINLLFAFRKWIRSAIFLCPSHLSQTIQSDLYRWTIWGPIQPYIPCSACRFDCNRNRCNTIRLDTSVDYASLLEGPAYVSTM